MAYDESYDDELVDFDEEDAQEEKYLAFKLNNEEYAIEIKYVMEIIGMQKFTPIPETSNYIKGVIKLREDVYPVLDLRTRFKLEETEYTDRTCIIIAKLDDTSVGFIVDSVSEVLNIPEEHTSIASKTGVSSKSSQYVRGIAKLGERVIIILDTSAIIGGTDLSDMGL